VLWQYDQGCSALERGHLGVIRHLFCTVQCSVFDACSVRCSAQYSTPVLYGAVLSVRHLFCTVQCSVFDTCSVRCSAQYSTPVLYGAVLSIRHLFSTVQCSVFDTCSLRCSAQYCYGTRSRHQTEYTLYVVQLCFTKCTT